VLEEVSLVQRAGLEVFAVARQRSHGVLQR